MTTLNTIVDTAALALLVVGAFLSLTAAIGLLRFPDVLSRLHAGTKPQVLGVILVVTGVGLRVGVNLDLGLLLLAALFQMLTIPVSAHMIGRAVYRTGQINSVHLVIDELSEHGGSLDPLPPRE